MKREKGICIYLYALIGVLLMLTASCKKDNTAASEIKLGLNYKGGIIFYIDATVEHGLIAATSDQSSSSNWWNGSLITTGATTTNNGSTNTTTIINAQGNTGSYAAKLSRDFKGGGFNDWYLPSKDELNLLYSQKTLVGGFLDKIYWSSTEWTTGAAWVQNFVTGEQLCADVSKGDKCVRAIRSF
jgi:hypothetical protein